MEEKRDAGRAFKNLADWKNWVFCAVLVALSIVLTRYASIGIGDTIRIGFGRLPVMLASVWFGPVLGMFTGAAADILGAIMSTGWNPALTIPAAVCGILPWFLFKLFRVGQGGCGTDKKSLRMIPGIAASTVLTKVITQGIMMTLLLAYFYGKFTNEFPLFILTRNAITVGEAVVETAAIYVLYTNRALGRLVGSGRK
ncbi:MAG: folate family ECF transporter S component [Clostridia bacterium]|nr:folate family ECF transporter S component [Clostridia bacterium]MBP5665657.1 folate family ECF transporter S component [Clostridia bacterium]